MENMLEHGAGFKAASTIFIKPILAAMIAFGWWPTADFVIIQLNDYVLLNPMAIKLLEELKMILGIIISIAVLIKLIMGIVKLGKKEK